MTATALVPACALQTSQRACGTCRWLMTRNSGWRGCRDCPNSQVVVLVLAAAAQGSREVLISHALRASSSNGTHRSQKAARLPTSSPRGHHAMWDGALNGADRCGCGHPVVLLVLPDPAQRHLSSISMPDAQRPRTGSTERRRAKEAKGARSRSRGFQPQK